MKVDWGDTLAQVAVFLLTYAVPLFIPGGIRAWPAAWIFMVIWFGFNLGIVAWLYLHNSALLQERLRVKPMNRPNWDKMLTFLMYGAVFLWLLFMAFDVVRFHWSPVNRYLQVMGTALLLCSCYLLFIVYRENTYLSMAVRIQAERGQTVISTGPYQHVRHPMYAAMIVLFLGAPLLLGSWLGIPLGILVMLLFARRAVLEEGLLRRELPGCVAYMAQVKYRLIPHVW